MARKFRFALQAVLDARQREEDEKMRDLANRRRALDSAGAELERIAAARERGLKQLAASAGICAALDLRVRDAYLRRLDAAFARESLRRGELCADWERARDALIAARRMRRTLERLRQRQRRVFEAEEARREELELDESNARAYDRARRKRPATAAAGRAVS